MEWLFLAAIFNGAFLALAIPFIQTKNLAGKDLCRYVQNGPYRILICIESPGKDDKNGEAKLFTGGKAVAPLSFLETSGRVFVDMDDIEIHDLATGGKTLGSARGCFDITW